MARVTLGLLLGVVIGGIDALLMLPLTFPDKRAALLGAFCARFALGLFAANVRLPVSPVASGVIVGVLTLLRPSRRRASTTCSKVKRENDQASPSAR